MRTPGNILLPLVTRLKACPTRDAGLSEKLLIETWNGFRHISLEHGDTITPAVMAGVILYDPESFAQLLDGAQRAQLQALGAAALEHTCSSPIRPTNSAGSLPHH